MLSSCKLSAASKELARRPALCGLLANAAVVLHVVNLVAQRVLLPVDTGAFGQAQSASGEPVARDFTMQRSLAPFNHGRFAAGQFTAPHALRNALLLVHLTVHNLPGL